MCSRNRRGGEYVDPAATLSAACARDAIPDIPQRLLGLAAGFESESGREVGRRSPREDEPIAGFYAAASGTISAGIEKYSRSAASKDSGPLPLALKTTSAAW